MFQGQINVNLDEQKIDKNGFLFSGAKLHGSLKN